MSGLQADNPPVPRANAQVSVIVPKESEYYFTGFCLQVPGKFSDPLGKVPARDKADGAMRLVGILVLEKIPLIFQVVNVTFPGSKCEPRPSVIFDHSSQC